MSHQEKINYKVLQPRIAVAITNILHSTANMGLFNRIKACFSNPKPQVFQHGVGSFDPIPDSVLLWTRISVAEGTLEVSVTWELAEDDTFNNILQRLVLLIALKPSLFHCWPHLCLTVSGHLLSTSTSNFTLILPSRIISSFF